MEVPGDEGELRRAKEVAEEMREALVATSRAVRRAGAREVGARGGGVRACRGYTPAWPRVCLGRCLPQRRSAPTLAPSPRQAERVVEKLDKLGAVSGDLGLALFKVAKAEEAQVGGGRV